MIFFALLIAGLTLPMPQPLHAAETSIETTLTELPVKPVAPAFLLRTLAGEEHQISDYSGQVVVVNFWATWCLPCLKEMPSLERAAQAMEKDGVKFLAINMGDRRAQVRRFLERHPLSLTVLLDPGARVSAKWQVTSLPVTYIVDRSGHIHSGAIGTRIWDSPILLERFRQLSQATLPALRQSAGR